MIIRDDLSDRLVHLTKGDSEAAAADNFLSIVKSKSLRGGTGQIRGEYRCVCFSEAPISKLGYLLAQPSIHGIHYAPLGVMLTKAALFSVGGRPVIYQPDSEFDLLPESMRFRHKEYDPENGIDFSWEREWRLQIDELALDPNTVTLVVPNRAWSDLIFERHALEMKMKTVGMNIAAWSFIKKYPWHFLVLEDLGIPVEFEYLPE